MASYYSTHRPLGVRLLVVHGTPIPTIPWEEYFCLWGLNALFHDTSVFPPKVPGGVPLVASNKEFLVPPLTPVLLVGHFSE